MKNVRFFEGPDRAEQAGFRPCLRCRPAESGDVAARLIASACRAIECAEEPPVLAELARSAGLSRFHFHRMFKSVTAMTPREYFRAHRAVRVRQSLRDARTVTDAMYEAGFSSSSRFYDGPGSELGMSPRAYRKRGENERLHYALAKSWLGEVLVAVTERGVAAVLIGDDPEALERDLSQRFASAQLERADELLRHRVEEVLLSIEEPERSIGLPLDTRGTIFQHLVWRALRRVPPGRTVSYSELASAIGRPRAARAVGAACAANPIAVLVPCHRVKGTDGDMTGYRWGAHRKQSLLKRERERTAYANAENGPGTQRPGQASRAKRR